MKIAFWSNSSGQGVTANMVCTSVLSAIYTDSDVVMFENHFSIRNLITSFNHFKIPDLVYETQNYICNLGLNKLIEIGDEYTFGRDVMVKNIAMEILKSKLYYLPTNSINCDLLEYRLKKNMDSVLEVLEQYFDYVNIDVSGKSESGRMILDRADMVVVNLSQNSQVLDQFFSNYSNLRKKSFIILGNYDADSILNLDTIKRSYGIKDDLIGVIPYNRRFADALSQGNAVDFLRNENSEFINECKRTAFKLREFGMKQVESRENYENVVFGAEGSYKKSNCIKLKNPRHMRGFVDRGRNASVANM